MEGARAAPPVVLPLAAGTVQPFPQAVYIVRSSSAFPR